MDSELNLVSENSLTLQLTVTPEILKGLQEESNFTQTPIEVVANTILERVLFSKVGKGRITGPANIGGKPLTKVTGPSNWRAD